jgi:hypothetical protein
LGGWRVARVLGGCGRPRWSGVLGGQVAADRVEVDQRGGPGDLQAGLAGADVAAFACFVAVCEQAEQPLNARAGAPEVLGRDRVIERSASGDQ